MKRTLFCFLLVFSICSNCVCFADTPLSDSLDGITVEILNVRYEKNSVQVVIPSYRIRNESGADLMQVSFEMSFFNKAGDELGTKTVTYLGEEPILIGETAERDDSHYVLSFDDKPEKASVRITGYKTTEEMPPIHVPREGEYLYAALDCENLNNLRDNLPVKITVHVDQMGYGREAVFAEEDALEKAVDAFLKIKVGSDDAPMVTDNYNWFLFEWEDGTQYNVRLNLYALEYNIYGYYHSYYLVDDGEFWNLAAERLEEVD